MSKNLRAELEDLAHAVLLVLRPEDLVGQALLRQGEVLLVAGQEYDLSRFRRIFLLGMGKAAVAMARGVLSVLGRRVEGGCLVTIPGCQGVVEGVEVMVGGHPLPTEESLRASQRIVEIAAGASAEDLIVVLISGGASALFEIPAPGISLEQLVGVNRLLLGSGAPITAMNVVRKHLSSVKGGQFARTISPAKVLSLILSDVPGDDLATVGSGPTAPDPTTFKDAAEVLRRYRLWEQVSPAVRTRIEAGIRGEVPDTLKPGDPLFDRVQNLIVGSGRTAAEAAAEAARERGFTPLVLTTTLQGEAREVGKFFAALARELVWFGRPVPPPALLVAAGETTVTVRGKGQGGRNQELALSFALHIEGVPGVALLALATDGRDGPTDAAGAIVDGGTAARIRAAGLDPEEALAQNDSYTALSAAGDLLMTGPTGTNVADLVILVVEKGG